LINCDCLAAVYTGFICNEQPADNAEQDLQNITEICLQNKIELSVEEADLFKIKLSKL
jgi:hypothetical protein